MSTTKKQLRFLAGYDALVEAENDAARWLNHAGQFARQYDADLSKELLLAGKRLETALRQARENQPELAGVDSRS